MQLDLVTTPFSRYGSYLAISLLEAGRLALRDLRGGDESPAEVFWLDPIREDQPAAVQIDATPERLVLKGTAGDQLVITFLADGSLQIAAEGLGLRLTAIKNRYDSFYALSEQAWRYDLYTKEIKYLFELGGGRLAADAPWQRVGNAHIVLDLNPDAKSASLRLTPFLTEPGRAGKPAALVLDFAAWRDQLLASAARLPEAAECDLAAYLLWGNTVHAAGRLTHDAVYMSKNRMQNIWSWDNAFIALALGRAFPEHAFNQLDLFFGYQDDSGVFPDFINDRFLSFNCCKPPVYGYFYRRLMMRHPFLKELKTLQRVYSALERNSRFWLTHRTLAAGTLPIYFHGNDSGWDNSTIFAGGVPVEAPDLATFLILQLETQAELARLLGLEEAAVRHLAEADDLFMRLHDRLLDAAGFFARRAPGFEPIAERNSLILLIPLLLYKRLPAARVQQLADTLASRFETDWGLATEAQDSALFEPNGYWRGPIWPAPTFFFVTALREAGFADLANRLRSKFFQLVREGGMAENFQPLTGQGLSDQGFSWTAAVYLLLSESN